MPNHGLLLGSNGKATYGWFWFSDDPCPFSLPVQAGGRVIQLESALTETQVKAVHQRLHTVTHDTLPASTSQDTKVPGNVTADAGGALVFYPHARTIASRPIAGGADTSVLHTMAARP